MYHESKKYYGLSEFVESTLSGHSLPLLRYDSSFEAMVMALGKRYYMWLTVLMTFKRRYNSAERMVSHEIEHLSIGTQFNLCAWANIVLIFKQQ